MTTSAGGDALRQKFGRIHPGHIRAFTRVLIRLGRHFDGDLDLLLIVAAIGDMTLPEAWSPVLTDDARLTLGPGDRTHQAPIDALSLAACTGIPRETVRRKLWRLGAMAGSGVRRRGIWP